MRAGPVILVMFLLLFSSLPLAPEVAGAGSEQYILEHRIRSGDTSINPSPIEGINSIDWSPDGSRIVTGGYDGNIKIWNGETANLEKTIPYENVVISVAWSPNGQLIAAAGHGHSVKIFSAQNGNIIRTIEPFTGVVYSVAWSSDGRWLAAAGSQNNTVRVWDWDSGALYRTFSVSAEEVNEVAWSPNSGQLASISYDSEINIWDVSNGDLLMNNINRFTSRTRSFSYRKSIAWSPDGRYIAASAITYGGNVLFLEASPSKSLTFLYPIETDNCTRWDPKIGWSPMGSRLAVATDDVEIWDVTTIDEPRLVDILCLSRDGISSVAWSCDGRRFAAANSTGAIFIWAMDSDWDRVPDYKDFLPFFDNRLFFISTSIFLIFLGYLITGWTVIRRRKTGGARGIRQKRSKSSEKRKTKEQYRAPALPYPSEIDER